MTARTMLITFACNDPINGRFEGRAGYMVVDLKSPRDKHDWGGPSLELESATRDVTLSVDLDARSFRLHRRTFRYARRIPWYGNWCCDAFVMTRSEGKRLLGMLRASGRWCCSEGPARLLDWFNAPRKARED